MVKQYGVVLVIQVNDNRALDLLSGRLKVTIPIQVAAAAKGARKQRTNTAATATATGNDRGDRLQGQKLIEAVGALEEEDVIETIDLSTDMHTPTGAWGAAGPSTAIGCMHQAEGGAKGGKLTRAAQKALVQSKRVSGNSKGSSGKRTRATGVATGPPSPQTEGDHIHRIPSNNQQASEEQEQQKFDEVRMRW